MGVAWGDLAGQPVLASSSADGEVRLWDPVTGQLLRNPETGRELAIPAAHVGPVYALAWGDLPDGPVLASGDGDGVVRLWDPATCQERAVFSGHGGPVRALAWRPGRQPALASASNDGTVKVWNPETAQEQATLTGHTDHVWAVAWGQVDDRPVIASSGPDRTVRLWDPQTGGKPAVLTGHTAPVGAVTWGQLAGQPVLASGSQDDTVRLWDPQTGRELAVLAGHTDQVWAVAWEELADRPVLASSSVDSTVRLWDPQAGRELATLTGHTGWAGPLAWWQLADRPVLASGGEDGTVRLWAPVIEHIANRLPVYRSDDPTDPDRLARDPEAIALAEMITARSARPPLAIGLFGDWGAGKSHFLGRIAHHVQRLAAQAPTGDILTYSAVRQIRFNAWHYAETDLWASLVSELFSQLASGTGDPGVEERRQSRLAAELAARRHLPERLRAAQERKRALQQKLDKLIDEDKTALWHRLLIVVRRPWFWLGLLLAAAAICVAVLAPGATARLISAVAGVTALLVTILNAVLRSINELEDQAAPLVEEAQKHRQNRRQDIETALGVATAQVSALEAEQRELTPAGQLTALIERRGDRDSPYRAHIGLMTQIREDFEQMAHLLATPPGQQPAPSEDEVGDQLPHIERIVVYIDDLDRCPPTRVVEVLEAVQLLLAVPLFVVVVAVDPRWLLSSLTVRYRKLLRAPSMDSSEKDMWESTPMQYLEKIFQIPFTLPPVDSAGYTSLVEALTTPAPDVSSSAAAVPSEPAAASPASPLTTGPERTRHPRPAVPVIERLDPLALTNDEQRLLTLFGPPFVTTPRSVKRLVNSYGLLNALRGSKHLDDLRETIHHTGRSYFPYRSAIALLATLIAFPTLSPILFTHLHQTADQDSSDWTQFLKQTDLESAHMSGRRSLPGTPFATDTHRWPQLINALQQVRAGVKVVMSSL